MKKLLVLIIVALICLATRSVSPAIHAVEKITIIKYYVGQCESGNKHYNVWGDSGLAYGKYQFHKRTFNWMKKEAGRPELKWKVLADQEWLFQWAIEHGYGNHWTCYRKAQVLAKVKKKNVQLRQVKGKEILCYQSLPRSLDYLGDSFQNYSSTLKLSRITNKN
jgi:hypothetical protein